MRPGLRWLVYVALALAPAWAGGRTLIWTQMDTSRRITSAASDDGTCEVTISELGSPLSFGPSDIKITVAWRANTPTAVKHGEEQVDQSYTFGWREPAGLTI